MWASETDAKDSVMASDFSHAFVAVALGTAYTKERMPWQFWALSMLCAVLPDADVLGFSWGVGYNSMWGHRGFSHSLCFALLLSIGVVKLVWRDDALGSPQWWGHVLYFFVVTASHGILDALTDGGRGIEFFAPFDTTRYFSPWRPIRVSPIYIPAFFGMRGVQILVSELVYIWLPLTLLCGAVRLYRRG